MRKSLMLFANILTAVLVLTGSNASAYSIETHKLITNHAFNNSVLAEGYLDNIGMSAFEKFYGNRDVVYWLLEGSAREDDTIPFDRELARYQHHYFDPYYDRGLDFIAMEEHRIWGYKAPDWALDAGDYLTQIYSIKDARKYYLLGLTSFSNYDRRKFLAKTFRALGQVLHTVEDMAQPQHTRNDPHGGFYGFAFGPQIFGNISQYEIWVEEELVKKK